jgi:UDP-N-acetylglucosamine acyltransferase
MMNNAGIEKKIQKHIANAYRLLFNGKTSVFDVIIQIRDQVPDSPEIQTIIKFLESTSKGIIGK